MSLSNVIEKLNGLDLDTYDDDTVLTTTRGIRLRILDEQVKNLPTSGDEFESLHKNLQELDKIAIQKKRIIVDSDGNQATADLVKEVTAGILAKMPGNTLFTSQNPTGNIPNPIAEIEGAANIIPGELDVGVKAMTYEDFMKNEGKEIDERRRRGELTLDDI